MSLTPLPPVHLYQLAYSQETLAGIEPGFRVLDNLENSRPDWFEYWAIRRFLLNETLDNDAFYGFFSPKFGSKTGLPHEKVTQFVQAHAHETDVFLFSPQPDQPLVVGAQLVAHRRRQPGYAVRANLGVAQAVAIGCGLQLLEEWPPRALGVLDVGVAAAVVVHQVDTQVVGLVCGAEELEGRVEGLVRVLPLGDVGRREAHHRAAGVELDRQQGLHALGRHRVQPGPDAEHQPVLQAVELAQVRVALHSQSQATGQSSPADLMSIFRCACSSGVGARQRR